MLRELAAIRIRHRQEMRAVAADEATVSAIVKRRGVAVSVNGHQMRSNVDSEAHAAISDLTKKYLAEDPEPLMSLAIESIDVEIAPGSLVEEKAFPLADALKQGAVVQSVKEHEDGSVTVQMCDTLGFNLPVFTIRRPK
jgi:hypothetical protein